MSQLEMSLIIKEKELFDGFCWNFFFSGLLL